MTNNSIPSAFYKGLKDAYSRPAVTRDGISMLKSLRWLMMKNGMVVEVKRANVLASTMVSVRLLKYDSNWEPEKNEFDISVEERKIEKGLFELEKRILEQARTKPPSELVTVLDMMRKNKLALPLHSDLLNEVVMNRHIIRIGYAGKEPLTGKDLFGAALMADDKVVATATPQPRIGWALDNLENTLYAVRREILRKEIDVLLLKIFDSSGGAAT